MKFELDALSQVRLLGATVEASDHGRALALLASGCAFAHPDVDKTPIEIALELRNAEIVEALLDAGEALPEGSRTHALEMAVREDRPRLFRRVLGEQKIRQSELDGFLHDAATLGYKDIALMLLEMGANPRYREKNRSCFERAVDRNYLELVDAMLARLTQQDKDEMLVEAVKSALGRQVTTLLNAGADPAQRIEGRTLLQLAPREADAVKRLLRAAKTAVSIEAAMPSNDAPDAAPARSPLTL